jgi:hypothetical protein
MYESGVGVERNMEYSNKCLVKINQYYDKLIAEAVIHVNDAEKKASAEETKEKTEQNPSVAERHRIAKERYKTDHIRCKDIVDGLNDAKRGINNKL